MKESDDEINQARLFEELTLERISKPGESPPYGGYGGSHPRWVGHTWGVRGFDCVYINADGKMHRIYGPAYVSKRHKVEKWFKEDELHRVGGPAVRHKATFLWYKEGVLHNLEGPAVIDPAGPLQYWIDGVRYKKKQYEWEIQRRKRKGLIK